MSFLRSSSERTLSPSDFLSSESDPGSSNDDMDTDFDDVDFDHLEQQMNTSKAVPSWKQQQLSLAERRKSSITLPVLLSPSFQHLKHGEDAPATPLSPAAKRVVEDFRRTLTPEAIRESMSLKRELQAELLPDSDLSSITNNSTSFVAPKRVVSARNLDTKEKKEKTKEKSTVYDAENGLLFVPSKNARRFHLFVVIPIRLGQQERAQTTLAAFFNRLVVDGKHGRLLHMSGSSGEISCYVTVNEDSPYFFNSSSAPSVAGMVPHWVKDIKKDMSEFIAGDPIFTEVKPAISQTKLL
eukprot:GILK01007791.1.p1 GENE.GILK01007791.1~~GILK01007791.1.p1  ORF type:complete len:310 (-),score=53.12 GILK01007791.1:72-962(-)